MEIYRKYNVSTQIEFPLVKRDSQDFESTPVTFAAGDVRLHLYTAETGAGTLSDSTNLPVHVEKGTYRLVLTAAEMTAKRITVILTDLDATPTFEAQQLNIVTFGNTSAQHDRTTEIRDAVDDSVIEANGSITRQQAESIVLAAVAGVTSNQGGTFKDPAGTSTRIVATVNASDERTAVTLTPSA